MVRRLTPGAGEERPSKRQMRAQENSDCVGGMRSPRFSLGKADLRREPAVRVRRLLTDTIDNSEAIRDALDRGVDPSRELIDELRS